MNDIGQIKVLHCSCLRLEREVT